MIRPGDVQRMSAGTGLRHSEYNHSQDRVPHFLQIWIELDRAGIAPGYEETNFPPVGGKPGSAGATLTCPHRDWARQTVSEQI